MHYPGKETPFDLPINRVLAERRLKHLIKRLDKDRKLHQIHCNYSDYIEDILKDLESQLNENGKVWYLPHHHDKTRVMFHCSAKFQESSLNGELLQRPDLTNTLVGVLTRSPQSPVALMADIKDMFYQV